MCGISGKISFDGSSVSPDLIRCMNSKIIHRGPDDEGVYVDNNVGLGQRRLSINDLTAGATAPISNEDGTIWLVFNGEIYNFKELRYLLKSKGHQFKTLTDTEVIIHAYEEYGYDCLGLFNGMFSFALWDSNKEKLFCARDRLGKKPFCYSSDENSFRFASEVKSIFADPDFTVAPCYEAIDLYLSYGYIPSPLSAFSGINKLSAAHYLICDKSGEVTIERYWSPSDASIAKVDVSVNEIKKSLKEKLEESVRLRMISDVPLGAMLSGGIDSTVIVALMAKQSAKPIKTFTLGFKGDDDSELFYAKLLADKYNTDHHELVIEPDAANILPKLVRHFNEPFSDSSAISTYYISKFARENVTVALTGDGGDESFAGYTRYAELLKWNKLSAQLKPIKYALQLSRKIMNALPYSNVTARTSRGLFMLSSNLSSQYRLQVSSGLKPEEKEELYTLDFKNILNAHECIDPVAADTQCQNINAIEYAMIQDKRFYLPDCLMVKSDMASMANSLELRSPLLDYKLVEFASSLPVDLKYRNHISKWIMRETFKELLPSEILNKPKTGFALPLNDWLRGDLNEMLRDYLLGEKAFSRGLFKQSRIEQMIHEHEKGVRLWHNRLWNLLILEIWFREFID